MHGLATALSMFDLLELTRCCSGEKWKDAINACLEEVCEQVEEEIAKEEKETDAAVLLYLRPWEKDANPRFLTVPVKVFEAFLDSFLSVGVLSSKQLCFAYSLRSVVLTSGGKVVAALGIVLHNSKFRKDGSFFQVRVHKEDLQRMHDFIERY